MAAKTSDDSGASVENRADSGGFCGDSAEVLRDAVGRWRADINPYQDSVWARTPKGEMMVAEIRGWGHLTGIGGFNFPAERAAAIQDAHTHLIAAAPDLLHACRVVTAFLDKLDRSDEDDDPLASDPLLIGLRRQAHAPLRAVLNPAIAKAEGRS